jgi:hypothetical protein
MANLDDSLKQLASCYRLVGDEVKADEATGEAERIRGQFEDA